MSTHKKVLSTLIGLSMAGGVGSSGPKAYDDCFICQTNKGSVNFHNLNKPGKHVPSDKESHSACTDCVRNLLVNSKLPNGVKCPYCLENITSDRLARLSLDTKDVAHAALQAKKKYEDYVDARLSQNLPLNLKDTLGEYRTSMAAIDNEISRQKQAIQLLDGNPPPLPPRPSSNST